MTDTNEFTPAWRVIEGVRTLCHKAFMCDEIEVDSRGVFTAKVYAAYSNPRALIPKFHEFGGQVIQIRGGHGNWWEYQFIVK